MKKRTFNSAQEVDDHQESEPVMKRARLQENGEIQSSSGRPTEYGNASKTQAEEQQKRANLDRRPREKQHRNKEAADILRNQHKIQVPAPREVCSSRRSAVCGSGNSSTVNTQPAIADKEYKENYHTHSSIGKGAIGVVKLATCKSTKREVVVKFICRAKVLRSCWEDDKVLGRVPVEVSLLRKLNHPNIVKIVDIFHNAEFFQMVMEKQGNSIDLFEYMDRSPNHDEALCSYIFRQVVSAVSYLQARNIVHRDIKDENIIINRQFQVKLIDFGSAAFFQPGKKFDAFCGTVRYCSPEVLQGYKYEGPEQDLWSLGVTLYTLVFGENPFFDEEETITCMICPPHKRVSYGLRYVIQWLLHRSPEKRATIMDMEDDAWVWQDIDISQYVWQEVVPNCELNGNTAADYRSNSEED